MLIRNIIDKAIVPIIVFGYLCLWHRSAFYAIKFIVFYLVIGTALLFVINYFMTVEFSTKVDIGTNCMDYDRH